VVDGVADVVDVYADDIKPAPDLGARRATDYILGLVPAGERMTVLLNIDRLVGTEVATFAVAAPTGAAA